MPRIPVPSPTLRGYQYVLENSFIGGLKTEFTGLNFPENACTSTSNCTFFHTGAVFRRNGFDYERNFVTTSIDRANQAISNFVWTNVGGDGNTKLYVSQIGKVLNFYQITKATVASPLSTTRLSSTVDMSTISSTFDITQECQYAAGNGYLFVFHPSTDPFYCTFDASTNTVASFPITLKIRDLAGIPDNIADNVRPTPSAITSTHLYNLQNQGWTSAAPWSAASSSIVSLTGVGSYSFTVAAGLPISLSTSVTASGFQIFQGGGPPGSLGNGNPISLTGIVNFYSGNTLTISVTSFTGFTVTTPATTGGQWSIAPVSSLGQISTWVAAAGNYPANSDVWWHFKNSTGVFDPATTIPNVTLGSGPAPKGGYILNAFQQLRSSISGQAVSAFNYVTSARPKTGTWFAGRVFYTGVDSSILAGGVTWTENLYFSQIVTVPSQFGRCYQTNDPTDETLFDILPSDGGVITIQGSGSIDKLVPITNGLLVFAANGIWFISGSQGIGFTATDYTVTKLSAIRNISSNSYVDVLGYPMFWNEEGVYQVGLSQEQQGISVNSLTLNTIKQFYDAIPLQSKKFARGSYNPITGQVQWIYKSTNETSVTDRYQYDSALTFSMFTQAFYPWTLPSNPYPQIHDVTYIEGPGGSTSPFPVFKYLTSLNVGSNYFFTFSEERDNVNWKDFVSAGSNKDYTSFFNTGYRLHGDAQRKFQPGYVFIYSNNAVPTAYLISGIWDYALSGNSGKISTPQLINNNLSSALFAKARRRLRIRGRGTVLQLQISSVSGKPFYIDGWSLQETQNASI